MARVICHKFLSVLLKKADGKDCYPTQVTESKVSKVGIQFLPMLLILTYVFHSFCVLKGFDLLFSMLPTLIKNFLSRDWNPQHHLIKPKIKR